MRKKRVEQVSGQYDHGNVDDNEIGVFIWNLTNLAR